MKIVKSVLKSRFWYLVIGYALGVFWACIPLTFLEFRPGSHDGMEAFGVGMIAASGALLGIGIAIWLDYLAKRRPDIPRKVFWPMFILSIIQLVCLAYLNYNSPEYHGILHTLGFWYLFWLRLAWGAFWLGFLGLGTVLFSPGTWTLSAGFWLCVLIIAFELRRKAAQQSRDKGGMIGPQAPATTPGLPPAAPK